MREAARVSTPRPAGRRRRHVARRPARPRRRQRSTTRSRSPCSASCRARRGRGAARARARGDAPRGTGPSRASRPRCMEVGRELGMHPRARRRSSGAPCGASPSTRCRPRCARPRSRRRSASDRAVEPAPAPPQVPPADLPGRPAQGRVEGALHPPHDSVPAPPGSRRSARGAGDLVEAGRSPLTVQLLLTQRPPRARTT